MKLLPLRLSRITSYCRSLGASYVVDCRVPDVVSTLSSVLKGRTAAGLFNAIGSETNTRQSAAVLHVVGGGKIVSVGVCPMAGSKMSVARISAANIAIQAPDVAKKIWGDYVVYVPAALQSSSLIPNRKSLVFSEDFRNVQKSLDKQKAGVSARNS